MPRVNKCHLLADFQNGSADHQIALHFLCDLESDQESLAEGCRYRTKAIRRNHPCRHLREGACIHPKAKHEVLSRLVSKATTMRKNLGVQIARLGW
jgi:hypothetical protein